MEMAIQCGRINISSLGGLFSGLSFTWMQPGPVPESKGMQVIFQRKGKMFDTNMQ